METKVGMDLIEFANKYGYVLTNSKFAVPELQQYQEDWFGNIQKYEFTITYKSRQMYATTMLAIYCAHFLLFNNNEKNKLFLKTPKLNLTRNLIERVRIILDYYIKETNSTLTDPINNKNEIKLSNGNLVKIINDFTSFCSEDKIYSLICDEAAFIDDLKDIIKIAYSYDIERIHLISSYNGDVNLFHGMYYGKNNGYRKLKLHYKDNKNFTQEFINERKILYGVYSFNREMELIFPEIQEEIKKESNKSEIKPIRFDNETLNNIGKRLIQTDKNLSDYIRSLVEKDLKENNITS